MSSNRFPYFRTFLTSLGFFTINLTWSTFSIFVPIFLKNNLSPLLGDKPILYTLVGLIMVLDNIAAILIQPYIGSLSDRTWIKKLGRRLPFIIIGLPLAALFFGLIGTFESTLFLLLIAISGFNISMAIYNIPVISLIPDTLPKEQHSQGNGVMNIVGGVANITGLLLSSYLYTINHALAFYALSIIMIVCLAILLINVREKKDIEIDESHEKINFLSALKQIFVDRKIILILMLFAVFSQNAGYQVAETFFSSYFTEILGFSEERAGYILGIFVIIQISLALPAGLLARKIGALNSSILGVIGFLLCLIPIAIISLTNSSQIASIVTLNNLTISWQFIIYSVLILILGFSWILNSINMLVVVWNMTPKGKTATYTSFYYVFWHLAAILSPFLAGSIFDIIERITGTNGLYTLFLFVLICYIISFSFLISVKGVQNKELKRDIDEKDLIDKRIEEKDVPLKFLPLLLFGVGLKKETSVKSLRQEHKQERIDMKQSIKELRKEKTNEKKENEIESKSSSQLLKEQKKVRKEKVKEQKKEIRDLKEEIISRKIKEKIEKDYNKKDENE